MAVDRLSLYKARHPLSREQWFTGSANGNLFALARHTARNGNSDAKDEDGLALIHYAACHGDLSLIRQLWEQGANMNLPDDGSPPWKPIHYAIFHRQAEAEKVLKTFGVEAPLPVLNRIIEEKSRKVRPEYGAHVLTISL